MKRAEKPEQHCRRQEFVCRLYDVIKDLDKSLKSDCSRGANPFVREQANPFAPRKTKAKFDTNKMGSECVCPPGCCQDSLEFKLSRIPNYPGTESAQNQDGGQGMGGFHRQGGAPYETQGSPHGQDLSEHVWHKPYHNNGCWAGHEHEASGRGGGAVGGPTSSRLQAPAPPGFMSSPPSSSPGFYIPSSPEEAVAMGCFVARAG